MAASDPPGAQPDILVAGAGIAGLALALALAQTGARVLVVDPAGGGGAEPKPDRRTAALLPPSVALLRDLGVWDRVADHAAPIRSLRIAEPRPRTPRPGGARFDASHVRADALAWNIPNHALHAALRAAADDEPGLELRAPARIRTLARRDDAALAVLKDGSAVRASLVVAADGRNSPTRKDAGIGCWRWRGGQKALAFQARVARGASGVCTEIHQSGTVLTAIPLPGRHAAFVWVLPGANARRLHESGAREFASQLNRITAPVLGPVEPEPGISLWPVETLLARRMHARRLAIAGEAAHVVTPIGAQGLNLSLGDARTLSALVGRARERGADLGDDRVLRAYGRKRLPEVTARMAAAGAYALTTRAEAGPAAAARRLGLAAIARLPGLRRAVIRRGAGLPRAARHEAG